MTGAPVNPLLFVYGTLLSSVDHRMSRRLGREADPVGEATFAGRLYRVSWYPGLVDGDDGDVVHGELVRLHDPARALVWLDEFEGVTRGDSSVTGPDDYQRAERPVQTPAKTATAWVYLFCGKLSGLTRVDDGRWPPQRSLS